MTGIIL